MLSKHTVGSHAGSSQLISMIHLLVFLGTLKGIISLECFQNFFLNLLIPPWFLKSLKFIALRLLANTFVSQKVESVQFTQAPKENSLPGFYHYHQGTRRFPISLEQSFLKIFFPEQTRVGGDRSTKFKKIPNLNLRQYGPQILINFIIFATFKCLAYVSLCNNLASSMLKLENFLTSLPYCLAIPPNICQIKSLSLHFFSFQKFPFLSFTKQINFSGTDLTTKAFQGKLLSHYVCQGHTVWL